MTTPNTATFLEFASNQEIIDELSRRCTAGVVVIQDWPTNHQEARLVRGWGGKIGMLGCLEYARQITQASEITESINDSFPPEDDGDEWKKEKAK